MRIKTIVEMIKGGNTLLDIGTDHGLVIIEAFNKGYIKKAIATDINEGPLKRAYKNITIQDLKDKVTFIQTDGFKDIKDEYDVVSITGLGYQTVKNILLYPHLRPKFYIFGVQSEIENFRKFLSDNNYKIIDEKIIYDKKFYIFIKAIYEEEKLTEEDIILGPFLKKNEKAKPYYKMKVSKLKEKLPYYKGDELKKLNRKNNVYNRALNNNL